MSKKIKVRMGEESMTIPLGEDGRFWCTPEWLAYIFEHCPEAKNPNYQEGTVSLLLSESDIKDIFIVEGEL